VLTLPCHARVDGVIRLNGYNCSIPYSHLENTLIEAVKSAGGILDDIPVVAAEAGAMTHDYLLENLLARISHIDFCGDVNAPARCLSMGLSRPKPDSAASLRLWHLENPWPGEWQLV